MTSFDNFVRLSSLLRLKKARALMLYLLLEPGRERRNSLIMDLFWQDIPNTKSQASLRQTVRHIREVSKGSLDIPIVTGGGSIYVDLPRNWSVLDEIVTGLDTAVKFEDAARKGKTFSETLDLLVGISDTFDGWLDVMQEHAKTRFRDALEAIIANGKARHAFQAAEYLADIDPSNEIAARYVMLKHWRNGSSTRAIDVYNRLYAMLDEAFDQEPEVATIEVLAAIKLDPEGSAQPDFQKAPPQKVTLSVQEVDNAELSTRDASFQAVLVSDLRSRLSRFREWHIIDSEPESDDFLSIHLKLFVIDGRSRLMVEVVRPRRRELLWSEIIDDPHKDWADKVRMLVINIGNALRVVIADRHGRDDRAQLYDRWLQSLALKGTWSKSDEVKAVALLRGITQEAPEFGPAHAELAGIFNIRHILRPGTFQEDRLKDAALSHALEAVSADAMDTRAHRVLAWCYCHKSEFDLAEFHFDQSLFLNPQNAHTIASCALGFAFCDNIPRTLEMIRELARLPEAMEPFHQIYLAAAHYLVGDFEACAAHCDVGDGSMSTVGGWHSIALAKLGDMEAAQQRLDRYRDEIAKKWCGDQEPTSRNIIDWYVSCFPLRNEAVRDDLRTALDHIAQSAALVTHVGRVDTDSPVER
ncbi:AfsR/SARP family transcriptional regulator [Sulfitobacter geojensis]|uniref:SARP family transcriptional regulator n=1 Tax=Sulfitobacter geojensis TaxID=1342299 RepID=A0AAE2W1X8_9RHOB|nr:BTAD domain-containing putative transcriptional regulator [Sulfitobacter geojensis]MBM1691601.1 SARP family transcriptional regulator [Sulfitobacter geojensis]MBM1695667.1 SARP family transcriptional regulator [Sulfitobacter geojensis]MBM1707832.1 SARP family transcriptional regulator [Sulfitobacter geojensis]MBM1711891.1 SARP family transcriptional regulator [Sulfitobacter geojensis]MBM1715956.1 SARP family transcriptional regulator [Sulfitobacter geojensis]